MAELVFISIYCVAAWKAGWTKAPSSENFCKVLWTSYEIECSRHDIEGGEMELKKRKFSDGESIMAATVATEQSSQKTQNSV